MIYIAVLNNLIVNGSARFLNKLYANDIDIGNDVEISGKTTTGQLVINGGTNFNNLSSGDSNGAPLVIGNPASRHIAIDADEIAGKNNATSSGHLWLNYGGGNVYLSTGQQIYANNGTFTTPTLRATNIGDNNNVVSTAFIATGNITTLNTNGISNAGAIVTRDMEVVDTLKSYKWDISHVANLANDFTVSPTLQLASGATIQFSAINTSTKVCTFTVTDSFSISSDSLGGVTWSQYSKVKFTMNLNNVVNSNCDGYLTVKMNSTAGTLVISGTLDDVTGLATGTNYNAEGATIMLYEVGAGSQSTTYPVGIRMTAYGSNKRSYIDIYGGTATSSWTTPHVRIGNVGGLTFNGETLGNQWGIYTDKGYFSGAIVSKEGNIGGFFIDQTNIHNNVTSLTDTSHTGIYLGTDGIRNYNTTGSKHVTIKDGTITANSVDLTGKITATSGSISGSLVSSGIDANNITAGTLSADRIGAGSITIGKINQKVYAYSNNGQGTGYAKLFTISHTDSYRNAPISFLFHNRGKRETRVSLNYTNNQTAASAVIQNATYDGDTAFYYVSKGNAVYDVYFALAESWDDTYVTDYINQYSSGLEVEWSGSYYGTSLPSGAVEFMKLVGSIAKSTIDDYAKTATTYITDIDSNKGITIKPSNSSGNDYLQINSSAISFYRNNVETVKLEDSAFRIGKLGPNMRNVYVTDEVVQIRNNATVLAEYGSDIKFYDGTGNATTNIAAQIGSTGISIKKGDINLGSGTFTVTSTGTLTATDAEITGDIAANTLHVGTSSSSNHLIYENNTIDLSTDWLKFDSTAKAVIIGNNNSAMSANISGSDFILKDKDSNPFFYAGDLRGGENAKITESIVAGTRFNYIRLDVSYKIETSDEVTVTDSNGNTIQCTIGSNGYYLTSDDLIDGDTYTVVYYTAEPLYAITFTQRDPNYGTVIGANSVNFAYNGRCSGSGAFCEGYATTASGKFSHAEGRSSRASGNYSHAEGESFAESRDAHAEGGDCYARGGWSHAEGYKCESNATYSHAGGSYSKAEGYKSYARGDNVVAQGCGQFVIGKYNKLQGSKLTTNNSDYAFIIGNGTSSVLSNAFTVNWNGVTSYYGDVTNTSLQIPASGSSTISSVTYASGSGGKITEISFTKKGNLAMIRFQVTSTSAITSGSNILTAQLVNKYHPAQYTTGVGYYGGHAIIGRINTNGQLIIRNASSSSVTLESSKDGVEVAFTYILKDYFV